MAKSLKKKPLSGKKRTNNRGGQQAIAAGATGRRRTSRCLAAGRRGGEDALVGGRRAEEKRTEADRAMDDPVVGVVVVEGPGKGQAMQLGYGSNPSDAGDRPRQAGFWRRSDSRNGHAVVTYDPRGRKFYVQHGGGTNLTYLDDQPVLAPVDLPALSHLGIGNTILRFVPLCGAEFDWQDTEESTAQ